MKPKTQKLVVCGALFTRDNLLIFIDNAILLYNR